MKCPKQIVQVYLSIRDLGRVSVCAPRFPFTIERKNTSGTKCATGCDRKKRQSGVVVSAPCISTRTNHDQTQHTRRTSIAIVRRTCSHFSPQSTPTHFVGSNQCRFGDSCATQWCTSVVGGVVLSASAVPEGCLSGLWNNSLLWSVFFLFFAPPPPFKLWKTENAESTRCFCTHLSLRSFVRGMFSAVVCDRLFVFFCTNFLHMLDLHK